MSEMTLPKGPKLFGTLSCEVCTVHYYIKID
jgi:hypothetical protein